MSNKKLIAEARKWTGGSSGNAIMSELADELEAAELKLEAIRRLLDNFQLDARPINTARKLSQAMRERRARLV